MQFNTAINISEHRGTYSAFTAIDTSPTESQILLGQSHIKLFHKVHVELEALLILQRLLARKSCRMFVTCRSATVSSFTHSLICP